MRPVTDEAEELGSLKGILDRVQLLTAVADQKTEVFTAIQTLALGFLLPEVSKWLAATFTTRLMTWLLHSACVLLALGVAASIYALFPRTDAPARSLTYFDTIRSMSLGEYRRRLSVADNAAWREDYIAQIHNCAAIAAAKFSLLKRAVQLFASGLAVVALAYCLAVAGY